MADVDHTQVVDFTQQLVRTQSLSGQESDAARLVQDWMSSLNEVHYTGSDPGALSVRLFGWIVAVGRYGPYTQDPVIMRLATSVRRGISSR